MKISIFVYFMGRIKLEISYSQLCQFLQKANSLLYIIFTLIVWFITIRRDTLVFYKDMAFPCPSSSTGPQGMYCPGIGSYHITFSPISSLFFHAHMAMLLKLVR